MPNSSNITPDTDYSSQYFTTTHCHMRKLMAPGDKSGQEAQVCSSLLLKSREAQGNRRKHKDTWVTALV